MKKLLFIAIAVFGLTSAANAQDTKIAHFSLDTIYTNLPSSKQAMAFLQEKSVEEEDKMVLKRKEIKKMEDAYVKDRETLPTAIRQIKEKELQTAYADMEKMQYEAQQSLEQYQGALNNPIIVRIKEAVANVAKKKGFAYVIEANATVYAGGADLTKEILAEALKLDKAAMAADGK
jgi:outer membrane protein